MGEESFLIASERVAVFFLTCAIPMLLLLWFRMSWIRLRPMFKHSCEWLSEGRSNMRERDICKTFSVKTRRRNAGIRKGTESLVDRVRQRF